MYVTTWSDSSHLKPFPRLPVMTDKEKDDAVKAKEYNNEVVLPYVNEREFPELLTFGQMLNKVESSQKHKKEFMHISKQLVNIMAPYCASQPLPDFARGMAQKMVRRYPGLHDGLSLFGEVRILRNFTSFLKN